MGWKDFMFDARGVYDYTRLPPRTSGVRRQHHQHNKALGTGIHHAMMTQGRTEYRAVIGQMLHAESIRSVAHAATDDDLVTGQRLHQACEHAAAAAATPAANPIVRLWRVWPQSAY